MSFFFSPWTSSRECVSTHLQISGRARPLWLSYHPLESTWGPFTYFSVDADILLGFNFVPTKGNNRVAQHRTRSFHFGAFISMFASVLAPTTYFYRFCFRLWFCLVTDFNGQFYTNSNSWSFHPLSRTFSQSNANNPKPYLINSSGYLRPCFDRCWQGETLGVWWCKNPNGLGHTPLFLPIPQWAHIVTSGFPGQLFFFGCSCSKFTVFRGSLGGAVTYITSTLAQSKAMLSLRQISTVPSTQ